MDEDFKQRVDRFFTELDGYLNNYCNTLIQAQTDQKIKTEEKENLVSKLHWLETETSHKIKKVNGYLRYL